jgi:hypothetical protein
VKVGAGGASGAAAYLALEPDIVWQAAMLSAAAMVEAAA